MHKDKNIIEGVIMESAEHVYLFGIKDETGKKLEGDASMTDILGGKGANLAEMDRLGLPVPPGFTITCQTCIEYQNRNNQWPDGVLDEIHQALRLLEKTMGKKLGDPDNPLLVSVRSGAPISMPGMMDTILNLGLNDLSVNGLIKQTNNPRFAWDSYRRFIQMFSDVVTGIDTDLFENAINEIKNRKGVKNDIDLDADDFKELVDKFKKIFVENAPEKEFPELLIDGQMEFPQDPDVQLRLAMEAVFGSWNSNRAVTYRERHHIPDTLGTAVNVQAMVFGNKGDTSATGVVFTRNPVDGTKECYGDFLVDAQGEDVVSGIRNTVPIADLVNTPGLEKAAKELYHIFTILENHYRDVCDIEFTIENGKLWMLQTRIGKRTALAAVRTAIDMVEEGLITKKEALLRIDPAQLDQLLHPQFDPHAHYEVAAKGMNASPGSAVGAAVFSSADAVKRAEKGENVVLVRWETTPEDLSGMLAAKGILTSHGGKTSHAAVIARGMGVPCVCGVDDLAIDADKKEAHFRSNGKVIHEGDIISINGTTGELILGEVPLVSASSIKELDTILKWADEYRHLGVRANADNPEDAHLARELGAEGIGLCRTEHMFLGERKRVLQTYILAEDDVTRVNALEQLFEDQRGDFEQIFEKMDGLPVIVRLLDPPLHEFLDNPRELEVQIAKEEATNGDSAALEKKRQLLKRIDAMAEANPMLGLRGVRLAIMYPELPRMQVRSIAVAAAHLIKRGLKPYPEIMVPLVFDVSELEAMRVICDQVIEEVSQEEGVKLTIPIGTMIELPRAVMQSEKIAKKAAFFSFGTNDLTQMTFGFSRDDVEASFLKSYLKKGLLKSNPFETIDESVAEFIRMTCERARKANPDIKLGVCGEHGGDPKSIEIFSHVGVDYVSCSPYRVPVARLAAAQAQLRG